MPAGLPRTGSSAGCGAAQHILSRTKCRHWAIVRYVQAMLHNRASWSPACLQLLKADAIPDGERGATQRGERLHRLCRVLARRPLRDLEGPGEHGEHGLAVAAPPGAQAGAILAAPRASNHTQPLLPLHILPAPKPPHSTTTTALRPAPGLANRWPHPAQPAPPPPPSLHGSAGGTGTAAARRRARVRAPSRRRRRCPAGEARF